MAFRPPFPHERQDQPTLTPTRAGKSTGVRSFREFYGGQVVAMEGQHWESYNVVPPPVNMYTVSWTNFEKHLGERFSELYRNTDSTDVSIYCGKNHEMLRAHQLVLTLSSAYFREALKIVPSEHPTVIIRDINGQNMGKIFDYIYLGRVVLSSQAELNSFLHAARYLQVIGIQDGKFSVGNCHENKDLGFCFTNTSRQNTSLEH